MKTEAKRIGYILFVTAMCFTLIGQIALPHHNHSQAICYKSVHCEGEAVHVHNAECNHNHEHQHSSNCCFFHNYSIVERITNTKNHSYKEIISFGLIGSITFNNLQGQEIFLSITSSVVPPGISFHCTHVIPICGMRGSPIC